MSMPMLHIHDHAAMLHVHTSIMRVQAAGTWSMEIVNEHNIKINIENENECENKMNVKMIRSDPIRIHSAA
jgi:hypothetical protein